MALSPFGFLMRVRVGNQIVEIPNLRRNVQVGSEIALDAKRYAALFEFSEETQLEQGATIYAKVVREASNKTVLSLPGGKHGVLARNFPSHARRYATFSQVGRLEAGRMVRCRCSKNEGGRWLLELSEPDIPLVEGRTYAAKPIYLHPLREKESKRGAFILYAETKELHLLRVESIDFLFPEKLLLFPSLEFEITGALERGAYPAKFVQKPQFATPYQGIMPIVGDAFLARVEKVGPQSIVFLLRNALYGLADKTLFTESSFYRGAMFDVEVETIDKQEDGQIRYHVKPNLPNSQSENGKSKIEDEISKLNEDDLTLIEPEKKLQEIQVRDAQFRDLVREVFHGKCVICGLDYSSDEWDLSQAAHIIPRAKGGPDALENALCLCPLHHLAFDRYMLAIDKSRRVMVAKFARDKVGAALGFEKLHGVAITFPETKGAPYPALALEWHKNKFDENNAM